MDTDRPPILLITVTLQFHQEIFLSAFSYHRSKSDFHFAVVMKRCYVKLINCSTIQEERNFAWKKASTLFWTSQIGKKIKVNRERFSLMFKYILISWKVGLIIPVYIVYVSRLVPKILARVYPLIFASSVTIFALCLRKQLHNRFVCNTFPFLHYAIDKRKFNTSAAISEGTVMSWVIRL